MSALTTNDVRVLRHLYEHGATTVANLVSTFRRTRAGAEVAVLRFDPLEARGYMEMRPGVDDGRPPGPPKLIDITADGARALRDTDRAAYGRWA